MPVTFDLILKNGKCFIDGKLKTVDIGISGGIIKKIGKIDQTANEKILDADNLTILPGVIDTQVHFREPGSTDVEDLETGSKAAVLGGSPQYLRCQILIHQLPIKLNLIKNLV